LASYSSFDDPYCYEGSGVLRNLREIRHADALEAFEVASVGLRAGEALPSGRFDPAHYRAIHHHLFQDVYDWAGQYRTVRIAREGAMFCYPEYIAGQMDQLFDGLQEAAFQPGAGQARFVPAASKWLAELNAIHPFREGNGRTQMTFLFLLADRADIPLNMMRIQPKQLLEAMVASFNGVLTPLEDAIDRLIGY
jgi:cell filamentation protein